MIEENEYMKTVKAYYNFLITEFGFKLYKEKVNGNAFYDIQYVDKKRIVSISYENVEDYLLVIIFLLQNGNLPDYDDKKKALHLEKLNAQVMPFIKKSEFNLNNEFFANFNPAGKLEKELLKSAKELRLCMKHFKELQME